MSVNKASNTRARRIDSLVRSQDYNPWRIACPLEPLKGPIGSLWRSSRPEGHQARAVSDGRSLLMHPLWARAMRASRRRTCARAWSGARIRGGARARDAQEGGARARRDRPAMLDAERACAEGRKFRSPIFS